MRLPEMVAELNVFYLIQGVNTLLAIGFNLFLVFLATVVVRTRRSSYSTIVIVYALFEALYAIVTFVGMPVHFVSKGTWIVFNHLGLLGGTDFSFLGPSLFCIFYQIWIILIVSHFVCRYIVVCKPHLSSRIKTSNGLKQLILFFYLFMIFFALTCGMILCTRLKISETEYNSVISDYKLPKHEDGHAFGYILLRPKLIHLSQVETRLIGVERSGTLRSVQFQMGLFLEFDLKLYHRSYYRDLDGSISLIGLTTILNHYALVSISFLIISFCTFFVWCEVRKLKKGGSESRKKEAATQSRILLSLLIQTAVPFIFCHIPSMIFLSIPFLQSDFSFGQYSLIFTWTTTAVKLIDPLIVMALVPDYRRALCKVLGLKKIQESMSSNLPASSYHSSNNGRTTSQNTGLATFSANQ